MLRLARTVIPPIYIPHLAGMIDVYHHAFLLVIEMGSS
jgi:hypothetical protein